MIRNVIMVLTMVAVLASCTRPQLVDGKVVLDGLESPDVEGVEGTLLKSAKASLDNFNYKGAAQFYAQLADYDKDNMKYRLSLADANRRAGYLEPAIESYDIALKKNPKNIKALEGKGLALLAKGEFDAAGDALAKVIDLDGKRWRTLNALGLLFVMQKEYDNAMAYYTEALMHSANNISVLNNIGLTLAIKGSYADAAEALETASGLAQSKDLPLRRHVEMNLALVYGIKGDLKLAKQIASRHVKGSALDNNMGFYAYLAKDKVLASSYLNMALSGSSRHYERAWHNLEIIDSTAAGSKGEKSGKRLSPLRLSNFS